jgi:hypothetical protein
MEEAVLPTPRRLNYEELVELVDKIQHIAFKNLRGSIEDVQDILDEYDMSPYIPRW